MTEAIQEKVVRKLRALKYVSRVDPNGDEFRIYFKKLLFFERKPVDITILRSHHFIAPNIVDRNQRTHTFYPSLMYHEIPFKIITMGWDEKPDFKYIGPEDVRGKSKSEIQQIVSRSVCQCTKIKDKRVSEVGELVLFEYVTERLRTRRTRVLAE